MFAALGRIHAGLGSVLRGDIATPSMVRARSRYSGDNAQVKRIRADPGSERSIGFQLIQDGDRWPDDARL